MNHAPLFEYLKETDRKLKPVFDQSSAQAFFKPDHIRQSVLSYLSRPAKRMRPSVLMICCGAVGGDPEKALLAAAGIELFHTWTLVHDDIIDNDPLRRGQDTVHEAMAKAAVQDLGLSVADAKKYGRDAAILAGDMQHGWSVTCFADLALKGDMDPKLALVLVHQLQTSVLGQLIEGQMRDVQLAALANEDIGHLKDDDVLEMMRLKTGVLYGFAGLAGAMIGLDTSDLNHEQVTNLAAFTEECGTAFQLQDDVLGITGDQKKLGKPIGSDIREGKKTLIVLEALRHADDEQANALLSALGDNQASQEEIQRAHAILIDLGGVDKAKTLAKDYLEKALNRLTLIEESKYKDLLRLWADFMINREL